MLLQHFLGHFKSEEDGARAYDRALITRKRKDGCLNFPISQYQDILDQRCTIDAHPAYVLAQKANADLHSTGKASLYSLPSSLSKIIGEGRATEVVAVYHGAAVHMANPLLGLQIDSLTIQDQDRPTFESGHDSRDKTATRNCRHWKKERTRLCVS